MGKEDICLSNYPKRYTRVCAYCGLLFKTSQPKQKYCGNKCSHIVQSLERKTYHVCKYCGKTFPHHRHENKNMYCSRQCAYDSHRPMRVKLNGNIGICRICGEGFVYNRRGTFCSDECRKEEARKNAKEKYFVSVKKTNPYIKLLCKWCGKEFEKNFYASQTKYCCGKCANKAMRSTKSAKARIKKAMEKRNERMENQTIETFSYNEIAIRDGWKCHICGKSINPKIRYPSLKAPTFDHLIPISNGGLHKKDNVCLAHFICNSKRSNMKPAQLIFDI